MRTLLRRSLALAIIGTTVGHTIVHETNIAQDAPPLSNRPRLTLPAQPEVVAQLSSDYVATDAGCASDDGATGLEEFFSDRVGPIIGFDSPRVMTLDAHRNLWLLQDAFVDYPGNAGSMVGAQYTNSTALLQDGLCFTVLQRGTTDTARSFDPGVGESFDRFFWPAGGSVDGDVLRVFWIEIARDAALPDPMDGANVHPLGTWLATYDVHTLQRRRFERAPNSGVSPIYGFDVVDDGAYSYLFGNSFAENLSLEGGYANGPHSATSMWLARVPRGRLDVKPEYRTSTGWSADPRSAVPISRRYWTENAMHPVLIDGRWVAVTKADGFLGADIVVDTAPDPWGPWTTVATAPATPRGDPADMVTYAPIPMPWLDHNGDVVVGLSQIDVAWQTHDGGDPARYRPRFFAITIDGGTSSVPAATG